MEETKYSILRQIAHLSYPIVLANILQAMYQLTDTFWVGRLGANAVAAVSLSFPITFLMLSAAGGMAIAGSVLVSHYYGAKNQRKINHTAGQTIMLVSVLSVIASLLIFVLAAPIMQIIGAGQEIMHDSVAYLQITSIGMFFVLLFMTIQGLLRGVGEVKAPLYIVLITVILNAVLDPLLIFGIGFMPAMGVEGAAIATLLTQLIAALTGLWVLARRKYGIMLEKTHLKPDFHEIRRVAMLGFPASIEQSTRALGFTIMTVLVAAFGTTAIASYGIGTRILSFMVIPALGLSMATTALVGQNMGAGNIEKAARITRHSNAVAFILLTAAGVVISILAAKISAFFVPNEPEVIASSAYFTSIMSLTFGFVGMQLVLIGAIRGAGKTFASMALAMVNLFVLQFPIAFVLSRYTPLAEKGIWWAFPVTNIIGALVAWLWFRKGEWKKARLTVEKELEDEVAAEF